MTHIIDWNGIVLHLCFDTKHMRSFRSQSMIEFNNRFSVRRDRQTLPLACQWLTIHQQPQRNLNLRIGFIMNGDL